MGRPASRRTTCVDCGRHGRTLVAVYVCEPCRTERRGLSQSAPEVLEGGRWVGGLVKRWEPAA